jgi:hypothetical protein
MAVSHITVATAEAHHPLPHYAHIHCFGSVNIQQVSMNVNAYKSFGMEEFNDIPLLHMKTAPLLLPHSNKSYKLLRGRLNLYCHTISIYSSIVGQ